MTTNIDLSQPVAIIKSIQELGITIDLGFKPCLTSINTVGKVTSQKLDLS